MESKAVRARFSGHRSAVYSLSAGLNGLFYSADSEGWLVEWNLNTPVEGRLIARMPGAVYAMTLLEEEHMLVAAVNRDGFHFIDLRESKEVFTLPSEDIIWFRMKQMPDGKILACGSSGRLALLDAENRSIRFLQCGSSDLRSMDFLPSAGGILLGNSDAELYFLNSQFEIALAISRAHEKTVFGLSCYPQGSSFVSAGRDARLNLFIQNTEGYWEKSRSLAAHTAGIHDVRIHPEKKILASAGMDKTIKIWDAETLRLLRVLDKTRHGGHSHSVNQLCWLAESDLLLSCSDDRSILAWDIYQ